LCRSLCRSLCRWRCCRAGARPPRTRFKSSCVCCDDVRSDRRVQGGGLRGGRCLCGGGCLCGGPYVCGDGRVQGVRRGWCWRASRCVHGAHIHGARARAARARSGCLHGGCRSRACVRGLGGAVDAGEEHPHRTERRHRKPCEQANRRSQGEPSDHRFALTTIAGVPLLSVIVCQPCESLPRYPSSTPDRALCRWLRICPAEEQNTQSGSETRLGLGDVAGLVLGVPGGLALGLGVAWSWASGWPGPGPRGGLVQEVRVGLVPSGSGLNPGRARRGAAASG
jgi:hypothetical protein